MRNRSDMTSWSLLKEAFTDIPNNATVILAALMLTGLAASMVLARHATDVGVSDGIHTRVYPARVFRSPIRRSWPRTGSGGTDVGWPVLDGAEVGPTRSLSETVNTLRGAHKFLESAPAAGHDQAALLTGARALRFSNWTRVSEPDL